MAQKAFKIWSNQRKKEENYKTYEKKHQIFTWYRSSICTKMVCTLRKTLNVKISSKKQNIDRPKW